MIAEGLKYLAGLGRDALAPKIVTVGDREYATANLIPVKSPEPDVLRVYTLQAVVDYLTAGFDRLEVPVVHIEGPGDVLVTHPLEGKWRQRPAFVRAACPHDQFPWGRRMDQETFMTFLQSRFVDTVDRTELLRVMGNLRDELVTTMADDGVSQEVTVKSGISRVKQARVPNPVILRPFRTFLEIEQPDSPFVVRLHKGNSLPEISLHEADGGRWQLDAVAGIREWLTEKLPAGTVVLA